MKYQKRNLWLVALAGALAIVFASGCDGDTTPPGGNQGPAVPPAGSNVAKVRTWENLGKNAKYVNADDVQRVVVSNDKKWAYFVADAGKQLKAWNVGAANTFAVNLKKDTQWKDLKLDSSSLDDAAGKSNALGVADNGKVTYIHPTEKGAFVSVQVGAGDNPKNGAYYYEEATVKAAWSTVNKHIDGGVIANDKPVFGLIAKKDNDEHPVLVREAAAVGVSGAGTLAVPGKLAGKIDGNTTPLSNFAVDKFVAGMLGDGFLIADASGIRILPKGDIGDAGAKQFGNVAAGNAAYKAAAYGNTNTTPKRLLIDGNKAYFGFPTSDAVNGGVAVHTAGAPGTTVSTDEWKGKGVAGLVKIFGKVYAVLTDGGIFEVKDDGKKGDALNKDLKAFNKANANTTDTYTAGTAPTASVTDAAAVGDNLIVTTSDKAIFVLTTKNEAL